MAGRPRSPDASSRSRVAQVGNLRLSACIRIPRRLGAANAPSPDVRSALLGSAHSMLPALRHPCLRWSATPALGARAAPRCPPRSTGFQPVCVHGSHVARAAPSLSPRSTGCQPVCLPDSHWDRRRESRPAVRPRANHAGRGVWCGFAPRLTALGLYHQLRKVHDEPVSQVPPAPSMSPAGCGAATTREHHA